MKEVIQKIKLIESLFLGYDIGSYSYTKNNRYLLDGQQRINAIKGFMNNEFSVFNDIFYSDLNTQLQTDRVCKHRSILCCG